MNIEYLATLFMYYPKRQVNWGTGENDSVQCNYSCIPMPTDDTKYLYRAINLTIHSPMKLYLMEHIILLFVIRGPLEILY